MKTETIARIFLFLLLAVTGFAGTLALSPVLLAKISGASASGEAYEIHARMPENGGWSVETIHAQVGKPIHLRMTSDDVLHSFAIGQSDAKPIDLTPGEWSETTLVFDKPGRYTYYCTRWCGRNHWRMRGIIEVTESSTAPTDADAPTDASAPTDATAPESKPLYLRLGLKVDAPHLAEDVPAAPLDAKRGAALLQQLSAQVSAYALDRQTYLENAPAALWKRLRAEPSLRNQTDADLWNIVAAIWDRQTTPQALERASQLYVTNCAACHGEAGKGDGVMVEGLPRFDPSASHTATQGMDSGMDMSGQQPSGQMSSGQMASGQMAASNMQLSAPPDLTNPHSTLGAAPALLEGKMLRGGMGTGMPYWGPIFTKDDMDGLIAYLYTFAMQSKK